MWLIPNSRRPERFIALDRDQAAVELREEIGVALDVPLIGFVGHLVQQKRPERAVAVMARLRAMGHPAHLVIAGDGPLRPELEAEVARQGLDRLVTFLGHRSDVEAVLGGVALALLTSEAEGIPGVAIEALMSGCPLVAFAVGGVDQVVEDGVTGVLIEGDDPSDMADAVSSLLDRDDVRTAMGRGGTRARSGSRPRPPRRSTNGGSPRPSTVCAEPRRRQRRGRAGTPTTTMPGGTSSRTTAPAPTVAPSPTLTPWRMLAPVPTDTPAPRWTLPLTVAPGSTVT